MAWSSGVALCGEVFGNMRPNSLPHFFGDGSLFNQCEQAIARHDSSHGKFASKYNVLLSPGDILRNCEIVWLET